MRRKSSGASTALAGALSLLACERGLPVAPSGAREPAAPVSRASLVKLEAAARAGDPQGYSEVVRALRSEDEPLRWAALGMLRLYLPFRIYPPNDLADQLVARAADPSARIREAAVWLMLEAVQEKAAPRRRFIPTLDALWRSDPVAEVRQAAKKVRREVTVCWGPVDRAPGALCMWPAPTRDPLCAEVYAERKRQVRKILEERQRR